MKILMLCLLLVVLSYGNEKCDHDKKAIGITKQYNIDLRTKSTKGWIRLLKNRAKYEIYALSENDRTFLIKCLVKHYNDKPKIGRIL